MKEGLQGRTFPYLLSRSVPPSPGTMISNTVPFYTVTTRGVAWVSGAWGNVLIFSWKILKMVDPKQILVIFKSGKKKKKKKVLSSFSRFHHVHTRRTKLSCTHFFWNELLINELLSDL